MTAARIHPATTTPLDMYLAASVSGSQPAMHDNPDMSSANVYNSDPSSPCFAVVLLDVIS
jgi:hypothetical protein